MIDLEYIILGFSVLVIIFIIYFVQKWQNEKKVNVGSVIKMFAITYFIFTIIYNMENRTATDILDVLYNSTVAFCLAVAVIRFIDYFIKQKILS